MSTELNTTRTTNDYPLPVATGQPTTDDNREGSRRPTPSASDRTSSTDAGGQNDSNRQEGRQETTVLVRGETISNADGKNGKDGKPAAKDKEKARKEVSPDKAKMQSRLPALNDDADVGVQKDYIVTRDGKADLAFNGTLLASAAPKTATDGKWDEYRVYETSAGKHVFSKVTRRIYVGQEDAHEADIFDPSPSSVPSQLLRSARDLTRSTPMTWRDGAVAFFGYDPLAKELYRKLSGQFEEHIS